MNVIVAYDISDGDRRARVAARLSAIGVRIQKSVFECVVDDSSLAAVLDMATRELDLDHDVLHVLPQCQTCRGQRAAFGQVNDVLGTLYWII